MRGLSAARARDRAVVLAAAVAVLACGRAAAPGGVDVHGAWVRPTGGPTAAAYLTLVNRTTAPVTLTGARTPAAASATLHESRTEGTGMAAMAHMLPLAAITVAPGDSAVLAPGGRHLMLEALRAPLVVGGHVPLTVVTSTGGTLRTEAEVREP